MGLDAYSCQLRHTEKSTPPNKRFGNYELDLSQIAVPPTDDLTFELEGEQEEFPQETMTPALAPAGGNRGSKRSSSRSTSSHP